MEVKEKQPDSKMSHQGGRVGGRVGRKGLCSSDLKRNQGQGDDCCPLSFRVGVL